MAFVGAAFCHNVIKIRNYAHALMNRQGLTTPSLRATPPKEGNFSETEAEKVSGLKFPSTGGVPEGRGGHPRRATKPYLNDIDVSIL